jgi:4-amino-4-deoxy-L-arabinose transferase-like glycosyltransferase
MSAPADRKRGLLRLGVVTLLLVAAFLTALPWLGCSWNPIKHVLEPGFLSICTFGTGAQFQASYGLPGFTGPYWGNLIVGVVYLIAAIFAASTRRSL